MRSLIASPLGFLVGLSLGALGGGGSILAVPALVYGVGEPARAATGTSLLVVGVAALIGVIPHWRQGNVRLGAGLVFGVAGIGGAILGTSLNRGVDEDILLVLFSVLMLAAGAAMLRRSRRTKDVPAAALTGGIGDVPVGPVDHDAPSVPAAPGQTMTMAPSRTAIRIDARTAAKVIVAGTVVGTLTGFFGVGGGFVIVPALVLSLGFAMPEAVGTSLVVIAINAGVALALRAGQNDIDWAAATPFLITAVAGTIVGGRIAGRIDARRLTTAFVVLLTIIAIYTGTTAIMGLMS